MDRLLEPPSDYREDFKVAIVNTTTTWWYRIHPEKKSAVYYSTSNEYRFNSPAGEFGVMYISEREEGAFAETFVRTRQRPPAVTWDALSAKALTKVRWGRPLRVVDFAGTGLAPLGLDNRLCDGDCYELAQRWALWLYNHPDRVDGITYRARNAPAYKSVAGFEGRLPAPRASSLVAPRLTDPTFQTNLGILLDTFGMTLIS